MHRDARFLRAAREHGLVHATPVHPRAAEIGQQRGMNVDHAAAKARDDRRGNQLQVAGQDDQLGISQRGEQFGGIGGVVQHRGRHGRAAGPIQRAGIGPARDHARDARAWRLLEGIEEGLQVRAAARYEHGDTNRWPAVTESGCSARQTSASTRW